MNQFSSFTSKAVAAIFAVAFWLSAAHGQSPKTPIQVDVPFAFDGGNQHLQNGRYTVWMESDHVTGIRGGSRTDFAMSNREQDTRISRKSKIVFRKYGERYFLSEVWIAGTSSHLRCPETRAEKQMELAYTGAPQTVELAQADTGTNRDQSHGRN